MQDKRLKKLLSQPTTISQTTRKKTIDFSKLGQKITLSDYSCHRCKTMIPVNEENVCNGPLPIPIHEEKIKKSQLHLGQALTQKQKKIEPCQKRYCNECLQKYSKDSWISLSKNAELWICPFCLESCTCSQCHRKRNKEGIVKSQFLSQFDAPQPKNMTKEINNQQQQKPDKKDKSKQLSDQTRANEKQQNKRIEKQILKAKQKEQIQDTKSSKIKQDKTEKQISSSKQQQLHSQNVKVSHQDQQWQSYQQSKQRFMDCLNQYNWNETIPALEILKKRLNERLV